MTDQAEWAPALCAVSIGGHFMAVSMNLRTLDRSCSDSHEGIGTQPTNINVLNRQTLGQGCDEAVPSCRDPESHWPSRFTVEFPAAFENHIIPQSHLPWIDIRNPFPAASMRKQGMPTASSDPVPWQ